MRKLILILLLYGAVPAVVRADNFRMDLFLKAIVQTETDGWARPGDGGRAQGLYQIHTITVDEANRILGRPNFFKHEDRHCPIKSKQMCVVCTMYRRSILIRRHGSVTIDRLAETWKAGDTVARFPAYAERFRIKYKEVLMKDDLELKRNELLTQRNKLSVDLSSINNQLELSTAKGPSWVAKAKSARSHTIKRIQQVDLQLNAIKVKTKKEGSIMVKFNAKFHTTAKTVLSPKQYELLLEQMSLPCT